MEEKDKRSVVLYLFVAIVVVVGIFVGIKFIPTHDSYSQPATTKVSDNLLPRIEYLKSTGMNGIVDAGITVANVSSTVGYKHVAVNIVVKEKNGTITSICPIMVGEMPPGARKKISQPIMAIINDRTGKVEIEIKDAFR